MPFPGTRLQKQASGVDGEGKGVHLVSFWSHSSRCKVCMEKDRGFRSVWETAGPSFFHESWALPETDGSDSIYRMWRCIGFELNQKSKWKSKGHVHEGFLVSIKHQNTALPLILVGTLHWQTAPSQSKNITRSYMDAGRWETLWVGLQWFPLVSRKMETNQIIGTAQH